MNGDSKKKVLSGPPLGREHRDRTSWNLKGSYDAISCFPFLVTL